MMNAEHSMQSSTLNYKTVLFRQRGIRRMNPTAVNNQFSNYYAFGRRAILFVCILFQINMMRAQSTPDSSKLTDTVPARAGQIDTVILKPVIRKPSKLPVDTIAVFYTDTLRFSAKK